MNTHGSDEVHVPLPQLRAAARHLTPVSQLYSQAARDLDDSRGGGGDCYDSFFPNVFARGGITMESAAYPAWVRLRDVMQEVMTQSSVNIADSADALSKVTESFADADDETRAQLHAATSETSEAAGDQSGRPT